MKLYRTTLITILLAVYSTLAISQNENYDFQGIMLEDCTNKLYFKYEVIEESFNKKALTFEDLKQENQKKILKKNYSMQTYHSQKIDTLGRSHDYWTFMVYKSKRSSKISNLYCDLSYEIINYPDTNDCEIRLMQGLYYCVIFKNFDS